MKEIPDRLRIVELRAENVKAIKAVAITPGEGAVTISGRNGAGKSSVLDAIAYALGGTTLCPPQPIRSGQKAAAVQVKLGGAAGQTDLIITRQFKEGKSGSLKVTAADGASYPSPQSILDAIVGRLAFDPLEFLRQPPGKQAEVLLDLAGLRDELGELEQKRVEVFGNRTAVNRTLREHQATLRAWPEISEDTPDEEVDPASLVAQLDAIHEANRANAVCHESADTAQREVETADLELQRKLTQLRQAEEALEQARARTQNQAEIKTGLIQKARALRLNADKLINEDDAPIREQINQVGTVNEWVRSREGHDNLIRRVDEGQERAGALTAELDEIQERKGALLDSSRLPVKGLSTDKDGATLNGIPLEQASSAEQLKVSLAIGWELNPRLRVMFVRDGSLLDDESLALIKETAIQREGQLWIERVHADEGEAAIVIEAGEVVT